MATTEQALTVKCPMCLAAGGIRCHAMTGRAGMWMSATARPHRERFALANEILSLSAIAEENEMNDDTATITCNDCSDEIVVGNEWEINGSVVCSDCHQNYFTCDDCSEMSHGDDSTYVYGRTVCQSCNDNYSWCDYCGDTYPNDDHDFDHDEDQDEDQSTDCCSSPAVTFAFPDGDDYLYNDTRATVTLPAGVIDESGICRISDVLWSRNETRAAARVLESIGNTWAGERGNFTRRLSSAAHKIGVRIPDDMLGTIGTIAREHSGLASSFDIELTRELNMSAAAFYHEDSCYWGGYSESRCALKSNGGIGLRTFGTQTHTYWNYSKGEYVSEERQNVVTGRAWIMPVRDAGTTLVPTFGKADAYVVFNGYGDLSNYAPARIVAQMTGMPYVKIPFECSPMYVNAGGYLVAPKETLSRFSANGLCLSVPAHSDRFITDNNIVAAESAAYAEVIARALAAEQAARYEAEREARRRETEFTNINFALTDILYYAQTARTYVAEIRFSTASDYVVSAERALADTQTRFSTAIERGYLTPVQQAAVTRDLEAARTAVETARAAYDSAVAARDAQRATEAAQAVASNPCPCGCDADQYRVTFNVSFN